MPRRKTVYGGSSFQALWKLMEEADAKPVAARFFMDGSVRLMTIDYAKATGSECSEIVVNEWDAVLGDAET